MTKKRKCSKMFSFRRRHRSNSTKFRDFFFFRFIECFFNITKRKMLKIIKRIAFNKITSFDEIINKLLKICAFIMMQFFISLFIVCIQQTYHLKTFKKINIITLKKIDKKITRFRRRIDRSRYWTSSKKFLNLSWARRFRE